MEHLIALQTRLANEKGYLAKAKTEKEIQIRNVWIAQIEKEIEGEYKFLGIDPVVADMSDEELLAELLA